MKVKYYGHSAFKVSILGMKDEVVELLIDPWIENPLSKNRVSDFKGSKIDYIFVTHDHSDHMGNAVELAKVTAATFVGIYELSRKMEEIGIKSIGANIGGTVRLNGIEAVLTPAVHSSSTGTPVGIIIKGKDGTLYHAGDTGLFYDMSLIGELYSPDVALLPIGGHYTMGIKEAAKAVQLIRPKYVIPMHYNTFPVIEADAEAFKRIVEMISPTRVLILKPGEEIQFGTMV